MHSRIAALTTALLATTAFALVPTATASASAGLTSAQVVTNLGIVGADADAAGTATAQITAADAATTGPAAIAAWTTVINDLTNDVTTMQGTSPYQGSDENDIATAYTNTVTRLQSALNSAIGQSATVTQAGQAPAFAAVFRSLESAEDSYGLTLIDLDPIVAPQLQAQQSAFDGAVQQAINAYSS